MIGKTISHYKVLESTAMSKGYGNTLDWVRNDPDLTSLQDDPEFKRLLDEHGDLEAE